MYAHLEEHYRRASVPTGVREIVRRAIESATRDGIDVTDAGNDKDASLSAAGKNKAVYVGRTRLSVYLDPELARQSKDADPVLVLAKESASSWVIRAPFAALTDPDRASRMESARRRGIPPISAGPQPGGAGQDGRSSTASPPAPPGRQKAQDRCQAPGCNLPLFDGSCGFH